MRITLPLLLLLTVASVAVDANARLKAAIGKVMARNAEAKQEARANTANAVASGVADSSKRAEAIVNAHLQNVAKDPGSLITRDALSKMLQANSFMSQKAGTKTIVVEPEQGFDGISNYQPSGWKVKETISGPAKTESKKSSEQAPVYSYPMGVGPVLFNQCTAGKYSKGSPCFSSKLKPKISKICKQLMESAAYIGVGFDGRGFYRAESRRASLVQRMCASKKKFQNSDVPDSMNVFGIYETSAETQSFQSVSQYMRYIRKKAGLSNQKNLFKSEATKYNRGRSVGGDLGAVGAIIGAVKGGPVGASLGAAIGGSIGGGVGAGSGKSSRKDRGTARSQTSQKESVSSRGSSSQNFFAMMFVNVILYEITLDEVKPNDISLAALKDFMDLPSSYYSVGADVKFQNYLLRWGTHYIRSGKFGGQLKITKTLRSDRRMSADQFASVAENEFQSMFSTLQSKHSQKSGGFSFLGFGAKWKSTKQKSKAKSQSTYSGRINQKSTSAKSAKTSEFTQTIVEAQGGTPAIAEALVDFYTPSFKQLYHDWIMSIEKYVKPFEFQLKSISDLFHIRMSDLFPVGNKDFGCVKGGNGTVKILVEPKSKRRYYIDTRHAFINGSAVAEKVKIYCKYSDLAAFKSDLLRRRIALERAVGVYMIEGPFPTSTFELKAGQPGCEEATLSTLRASSSSSSRLNFAEMKKAPFLLIFDMPSAIGGIATRQGKYRMIYRDGMWFATDPKATTMHLYDGCEIAAQEAKKEKICFRNIILTYTEGNGFFHIDPADFLASKQRIPSLPQWLSGSTIARPKRLQSLMTIRNKVMVSKAAVPCNVRWLNSHRLDPNRGENCVHFTAATEGDIFVIFASTPRDHYTWYYLQINPRGVAFYQGMKLQKSDIEEGMGVLGDKNLFQSFFVCVSQSKKQVIMQYGKADPDSEVGKVYSGYTFPARSQYSRLSFYSFGSGTKSASLMDVRLTKKIPTVTCLNDNYIKKNGHCVLNCHAECKGCTRAKDNKACHHCVNLRVEAGLGARRMVTCLSQCPRGTYLSGTNKRLCVPCPPGKYKKNSGNSKCHLCPLGTFSNAGAVQCSSCPAGTFNDRRGQSKCRPCRPGRFSSSRGATACTRCLRGTFSPGGKASCSPCPKGHYSSARGSASCTPCSRGLFTSSSGQQSCRRCPTGTSSARGSMSCSNSCNKGEFSPRKGVPCKKCTAGSFAESAGSSSCTKCQSGTYQPRDGQATCYQAPAGSYVPRPGSSSRVSCPAGTFNSRSGQKSSAACVKCRAGTYSLAGASRCTPCARGHYQPKSGQSTCIRASKGHYADREGLVMQKNCPGGTFGPTMGATSRSQCTKCPAGQYSSRPAAASCQKCPNSRFSTAGSVQCFSCPAGQFAWKSLRCKVCPAGSYSASVGVATCTLCPAGHYSSKQQSTSCQRCGKGYYASGRGNTQCKQCPAGSFSNKIGAGSCTPCPLGHFSRRTAATTCYRCSPGHFASRRGLSSCSPCRPGTYNPNSGQSNCHSCPVSQFSSTSGARSCRRCPSNRIAPRQGSSSCSLCGFDRFAVDGRRCAHCSFNVNSNRADCFRRERFRYCTQSSTFRNRRYSCRKAMDGNRNRRADSRSYCAHTKRRRRRRNPFWHGTLRASFRIKRVVIWSRRRHRHESNRFYVYVYRNGHRVGSCGYIGRRKFVFTSIDCRGLYGNQIRIQRNFNRDYLTLCEVEVWVG